MSNLYKDNISSILIEGGRITIQKFIDSNFWDEARLLVGEKKIENFTSEILAFDISQQGPSKATYFKNFSILKSEIKKILKPNDTVVFMGAGSISTWCNKFAKEMILKDQNNE